MPIVRHYVDNSHQSHNIFMYDVIDVEYLREHPLFICNPRALQIFLHVKKHKFSMFYFTLGKIPLMFKSRLAPIQLIAVARTNNLSG